MGRSAEASRKVPSRRIWSHAGIVMMMLVAAFEAAAHETGVPPIVVGASGAEDGALRITRERNDAVVLDATSTVSGFVLYTAADPSFENPEDTAADPFPIADDIRITVELVARTGTAAVKLRGETLDAAGESVVLGTAPSLHAHPEWQLTVPEGQSGCESLRLRLHADDAYEASEEYTLRLATDDGGCLTCGDADANGTITVTDGVVALRTAAGLGDGCAAAAACDLDGNGTVSVSDGVNVLRLAAGLATDATCPDL